VVSVRAGHLSVSHSAEFFFTIGIVKADGSSLVVKFAGSGVVITVSADQVSLGVLLTGNQFSLPLWTIRVGVSEFLNLHIPVIIIGAIKSSIISSLAEFCSSSGLVLTEFVSLFGDFLATGNFPVIIRFIPVVSVKVVVVDLCVFLIIRVIGTITVIPFTESTLGISVVYEIRGETACLSGTA